MGLEQGNLNQPVEINYLNLNQPKFELNEGEEQLNQPPAVEEQSFEKSLKDFGTWITGGDVQTVGGDVGDRVMAVAVRSFALAAGLVVGAAATPLALTIATPIMIGIGINHNASKIAEAFAWAKDAPNVLDVHLDVAGRNLNNEMWETLTNSFTKDPEDKSISVKEDSKHFISQRDADYVSQIQEKYESSDFATMKEGLSDWELSRITRIHQKFKERQHLSDILVKSGNFEDSPGLIESEKKEIEKMSSDMAEGRPLSGSERSTLNSYIKKHDDQVTRHQNVAEKLSELFDSNHLNYDEGQIEKTIKTIKKSDESEIEIEFPSKVKASLAFQEIVFGLIEKDDQDDLDGIHKRLTNVEKISEKDEERLDELLTKYSEQNVQTRINDFGKLIELVEAGYEIPDASLEKLNAGQLFDTNFKTSIYNALECVNKEGDFKNIKDNYDQLKDLEIGTIYQQGKLKLDKSSSTKTGLIELLKHKNALKESDPEILNKFENNKYLTQPEMERLKKINKKVLEPLVKIREEDYQLISDSSGQRVNESVNSGKEILEFTAGYGFIFTDLEVIREAIPSQE